jgi:hypothetical protein
MTRAEASGIRLSAAGADKSASVRQRFRYGFRPRMLKMVLSKPSLTCLKYNSCRHCGGVLRSPLRRRCVSLNGPPAARNGREEALHFF